MGLEAKALSYQVLKCGTSVGSNYEEADDGSSDRDTLAKRKIALREIKEGLVAAQPLSLGVGSWGLEVDYFKQLLKCAIVSLTICFCAGSGSYAPFALRVTKMNPCSGCSYCFHSTCLPASFASS